jgi:hypothetical protein
MYNQSLTVGNRSVFLFVCLFQGWQLLNCRVYAAEWMVNWKGYGRPIYFKEPSQHCNWMAKQGVISEMMEKLVEWLAGETEVLGENLPPVPLCPPQTPHAAAVGSQRLTAWATAWPTTQFFPDVITSDSIFHGSQKHISLNSNLLYLLPSTFKILFHILFKRKLRVSILV